MKLRALFSHEGDRTTRRLAPWLAWVWQYAVFVLGAFLAVAIRQRKSRAIRGSSPTTGFVKHRSEPETPIEDWQLAEALSQAADKRDWPLVLRLLEQGADPHGYCPVQQMSVLAYAVRCGEATAVRALLAAGASATHLHDPQRQAPVFQAIQHGHAAILRLLLRSRLNVEIFRDTHGNSLLMTAFEFGASRGVIDVVHEFVPFRSHSAAEQQTLIALAERMGQHELTESFQRPVPKSAPTVAREALEQGIKDIELGRTEADGVSYLPLSFPNCIDFHNIDGRGRTEVGSGRPPWLLTDKDRELMRRTGAQWFEPFIEKLNAGEDVTLDDLRRAFKAATGRELRVNTIE
jgi:hypothetical protein